MKSILHLFTLLVMFSTLSNLSQGQELYAEVDGNIVTLWETQAWRNCGSMYSPVVDQVDNTLNWYQVDTGMTATCNCTFDLSVTFGPLVPGDYTANVYYTDAWAVGDTFYVGTVYFTIDTVLNDNRSGGIISSFQSECYSGQGIDETADGTGFSVYPVPVRTGEAIHFESKRKLEDARIEIFTISGQKIFTKEYGETGALNDLMLAETIFPAPGIYTVRLTTTTSVSSKLITKL